MKKLAVIGVALGIALGLAGCSTQSTEQNPKENYTGAWVDTKDGRVVWCLIGYNRLSCDWGTAK